MPVRRFFLLLKSAQQIEASEKMTLCDIQAISITSSEYYQNLRKRFAYFTEDKQNEVGTAKTSSPPINALVLEGEDATQAMFEVFGAAKRMMNGR